MNQMIQGKNNESRVQRKKTFYAQPTLRLKPTQVYAYERPPVNGFEQNPNDFSLDMNFRDGRASSQSIERVPAHAKE